MRSFEAGAGPAITLLCPCPGVCAPQLASKPPATRPHNATRRTVSRRSHPPAEQRGYEVTRGKVVCRERLARQWHARGQGFKSPQLHPRSEALSPLDRPRIARLGQQIGSNLFSKADPIVRRGRDAGGRRQCRRPVDPGTAPGLVPVPSGRGRRRRSGPPRPGTDRPAGHGKADSQPEDGNGRDWSSLSLDPPIRGCGWWFLDAAQGVGGGRSRWVMRSRMSGG